MRSEQIKYSLARGLPIIYEFNNMAIRIFQPTIKEIEEILFNYDSYKFVYSATKENLELSDGENIDKYEGLSYFQILFKLKNQIYFHMLLLSLTFFLKVKLDNIRLYLDEMKIVIVSDEGQEIFTLDNSNFEEFSEFIRLICCCEKIKNEEDKDHLKPTTFYKNKDLQKMYEDSLKQYNDYMDKKKRENSFTLADIISSISINEKSKYKFKDIDDLTMWQLYFIYNSMFVREGNEFTKMQFCSYKFSFDDTPNFEWNKEIKIKLPESMIEKIN